MRQFLSAICFLMFTFVPQHKAYSQETDSHKVIQEVQDLAQWTESYFVILNDMVLLFSNQEINAAIAAIDTDDTNTIREATITYGENRRLILTRMEKAIDNLDSIPDLKTMKKTQGRRVGKLVKAMNTQLELLPVLYDEIAVASGHMETLLLRISKGDYSGVSEIGKQQNLALIRFMEAENLQVEAALLALKDDNPNYAFQLIVLAQNNIGIEELRMANLSMDSDLSDRTIYNTQIKAELDTIPGFLKKGRAGQKKMLSQIQSAMPHMKTEKEKAFINSAIAAVDTFTEAFDIEREMYNLALKSYEYYTSDKLSWEIEGAILANDQEIAALALKRSDLMDKRVRLLKQ